MEIYGIFFLILFAISYIIPLIFTRMHTPYAIKNSLRKLMKFNDHGNYIEIKKHEFRSTEKFLILSTIIVFILVGGLQWTKINLPILKAILGMIIFAEIGTYIGLVSQHRRIIKKLYILKDKLYGKKIGRASCRERV